MSVSKIPFWAPAREYAKYGDEWIAAVRGCLSRGEMILGFGEEIADFERSFAKMVGSKYCVMTGSGTHSLFLAYKACGIGPGDEVITTAHTFVATINQIVACGARPVLVDINDEGLLDPEGVEKAMTPRTKAIVPVHLEGKVCDMKAFAGIAKRHDLRIIEDACQAIGASRDDLMAGATGDVGCFSFHPAKVLGCIVNTGAIVTDNYRIAEYVRWGRQHFNIGKGGEAKGGHGWNLKPDTIAAAVLNVKLKYLGDRLARRHVIAAAYNDAFRDGPLGLPFNHEGRVWQDYVVRSSDRPRFLAHLEENGIGHLGGDLEPNHLIPELGFNVSLPETEAYINTQIRIPLNPDLTDEEVEYIIDKVSEFK